MDLARALAVVQTGFGHSPGDLDLVLYFSELKE